MAATITTVDERDFVKDEKEDGKDSSGKITVKQARDNIKSAWELYKSNEKKMSCRAAFVLSLMEDARAKGKQVESVIAHSWKERISFIQDLLHFCDEGLDPSSYTKGIPEISEDDPALYTSRFFSWPDHPLIVTPSSDTTGAGPDITVFLHNTNRKIVIFVSLKTSSSGNPVSRSVCQAGVESIEMCKFWGKRGENDPTYKDYKDTIVSKMEAKNHDFYMVQISLPGCSCKNHDSIRHLSFMTIKQLQKLIHRQTVDIVTKAFPENKAI